MPVAKVLLQLLESYIRLHLGRSVVLVFRVSGRRSQLFQVLLRFETGGSIALPNFYN
ncbi:hypothetical protein Osc7112_1200 [Oscillatoria nigro-viridis PCC 7112]|uniref:Uncharacterized protein n=1 Tax=Phormidium nigroviride PCC 7112 TaxID=179408 RepID=K9VCU1_9CYAN|nr:hypothetical protein Osc7112_1200 [Oscillatoria nigro-viridis PCC 7112]